MQAVDHKGNIYPSISAMCKAYGIPLAVYNSRMKTEGWTKEEALTIPVGEGGRRAKAATDHRGIKYPTTRDMCTAYGISVNTYRQRLGYGWTQEEALTTPLGGKRGETEKVTDHKGQEYRSEREMCAAYGVKEPVFQMRRRFGWSLKDALETKG